MNDVDLAIVGGGPAGYVAAIRGAQLGLRTTLIEREHLGGICLNWGCIPTKALLRSSELVALTHHIKDFGLKIENVTFSLDDMVQRSRAVARRLAGGVGHLLKKNGVTVIAGTARLEQPGVLSVDVKSQRQSLAAKHIILATGARARTLPSIPSDDPLVWTYREAMVPTELPKRLLIIGSGAIGIEFASFFAGLGSQVTVVEMQPVILPVEDHEISAFAERLLRDRGLNFHLNSTVKAIQNMGVEAVVEVLNEDGEMTQIAVDRVISAIGIVGNVEGLGLEQTQVKVERGHIQIDGYGRTGESGVYAVGDVCGPPWLAHKASHEAVICVEAIAGVEGVKPIDVTKIPGCTYSTPQVASVGYTERGAAEAGYRTRVGRFPFLANGKALAMGEAEGMVKTVFDEATGELLGAHMAGPEVTELIQGFVLARQLEATEADLTHTVFPHPTLSEMMHEAVLDAYGRAIHF